MTCYYSQESISDFYWHYSSYEAIDAQGREIFFKAFRIAKQIFRTLTEFIQVFAYSNN